MPLSYTALQIRLLLLLLLLLLLMHMSHLLVGGLRDSEWSEYCMQANHAASLYYPRLVNSWSVSHHGMFLANSQGSSTAWLPRHTGAGWRVWSSSVTSRTTSTTRE